jgi:GTP cyclohydrolase I
MITDTGDFYSNCEHHGVPFFGKYYFAYIPHPEGKILGLSKVARVVDYFSAKLQIQERLVHEVSEYLWKTLSKDSQPPIGMAFVMEAEHLCKTMRGVKKKGKMRTTELRGAIKEDASARAEFMGWVNSNGR